MVKFLPKIVKNDLSLKMGKMDFFLVVIFVISMEFRHSWGKNSSRFITLNSKEPAQNRGDWKIGGLIFFNSLNFIVSV